MPINSDKPVKKVATSIFFQTTGDIQSRGDPRVTPGWPLWAHTESRLTPEVTPGSTHNWIAPWFGDTDYCLFSGSRSSRYCRLDYPSLPLQPLISPRVSSWRSAARWSWRRWSARNRQMKGSGFRQWNKYSTRIFPSTLPYFKPNCVILL